MQASIPRSFDIGASADYSYSTSGAQSQTTQGQQVGVVVNQYFYGDVNDYKKQQREAAKQMRNIVRTVTA
jgi:hypothetical protein